MEKQCPCCTLDEGGHALDCALENALLKLDRCVWIGSDGGHFRLNRDAAEDVLRDLAFATRNYYQDRASK